MIKAEMERIEELYKNDEGMRLTDEQETQHRKAKTC